MVRGSHCRTPRVAHVVLFEWRGNESRGSFHVLFPHSDWTRGAQELVTPSMSDLDQRIRPGDACRVLGPGSTTAPGWPSAAVTNGTSSRSRRGSPTDTTHE